VGINPTNVVGDYPTNLVQKFETVKMTLVLKLQKFHAELV